MYKKYGVCIKKKINKCISKQTITQQFVREETSNEKLSCRNHILFFFPSFPCDRATRSKCKIKK